MDRLISDSLGEYCQFPATCRRGRHCLCCGVGIGHVFEYLSGVLLIEAVVVQ